MTQPWGESTSSDDPARTNPQSFGGVPQPHAPQHTAPAGLAIASGVIAIAVAVVELATAVAVGPAIDGSSALTWGPYVLLELLVLPLLIAAYVVGCLWLQFARANALALQPGSDQRSVVWLWLGWWVPIVSFWFPNQTVGLVQKASGSRAAPAIGLGLWWTAWLVYLIGNRISANTSVDSLPAWEAITALAAVVACVQWCRILQRITANQRAALVVA